MSTPCHYCKRRDPLEIIVFALLMLAIFVLFQKAAGIRAVLSESNLQSNLGRISTFIHAPQVDCVLVGSSIAGRLLPSFFRESGMEVYNLGLDGSRPLFGFEIVRMRNPPPRVLLIDTSTLFIPNTKNDRTLHDEVTSMTFSLEKWFGFLRPENRPSSLLYWNLKDKKDDQPSGKKHSAKSPSALLTQANTADVSVSNSAVYDQLYDEVKKSILSFQKQGVQVILVEIPRADGWGASRNGMESRLAKETGIRLIEPGVALARDHDILGFSDGLHLDVPSAKLVSKEIVKEIREQ